MRKNAHRQFYNIEIHLSWIAAIPNHRCYVVLENETESEKCNINSSTLTPDTSNANAYSYERSCMQFNQTPPADVLCSGNLSEFALIPCENGWLYDTSTYDSTIVTEVSESTWTFY